MAEYLYIGAVRDEVRCGNDWEGGMLGELMLGWRVMSVHTSHSPDDGALMAEMELEFIEDQASQGNPDWITIEKRIRVYELDGPDRAQGIVTTIDFDPWLDPGDQKDFYREGAQV